MRVAAQRPKTAEKIPKAAMKVFRDLADVLLVALVVFAPAIVAPLAVIAVFKYTFSCRSTKSARS